MDKPKKFKSKTLQTYNAWKATRVGLYVGMWSMPFIPATIMTAINWEEWFEVSGLSLPFGFASLLVTTVLSIVGIMKKDELFKTNVSALFYIAMLFAMFGVTNLFFASLFTTFGQMFLATAGGLVASATCDQFNKSLVKSRIEEYKKYVEDNALDRKTKKRNERRERAMAEAKAEAEALQATE